MRADNLEAERRDGERRHFEYDWQAVAAHVPAYAAYVEQERARLGETHPAFRTQYLLQPIANAGRLFSASQLAQLQGTHVRMAWPVTGEVYAAGLDLAGGPEDPAPSRAGGRDSTVLTIGRVVPAAAGAIVQDPRIEIVEHLAWTGESQDVLLPRLVDLLREVWRVAAVAVDATGLGETTARALAKALPHARVEAVTFSAQRKSELGYALIAAVNGGRLKAYAGDGSPEHAAFHQQFARARMALRSAGAMTFGVDPAEGHDDYMMSAALLVAAAWGARPRVATGRVR